MNTKTLSCLCAIFAFVLISTLSAVASNNHQSACLNEASTEYKNCVSECKETLQVDQDACRNVNHECADACRAGYDTCTETPNATLKSCNDGCNSTLSAADKVCHATYKKGDPQLKNCTDQADQAAILCRASCQVQVQPEFSQCKMDFNACIKACPPASGD